MRINKKFTIIGALVLILLVSSTAGYIYLSNEDSKESGKPTKDQKDNNPTVDSNEEIGEEPTVTDEVENPVVNEFDPIVTQPEQPIVTTPSANWWEYPANIMETSRSGDDMLVLVNKSYRLPASYGPSDLIQLSNISIRLPQTIYARSILVNDLTNLGAAASADGVDLSIVSGYRSYQTQASTYQYWVDYNGGNVAAADTISARPGHSQHQLGTAVDFGTNEAGDQIGNIFTTTVAADWLKNNAWKYGFVIAYPEGAEPITGYAYESWHYRYIGVSNATEWNGSGLTLEEWLRGKN